MILITLFIVLIGSLLYVLYVKSRQKFDYWKKRNVPHQTPLTIFGNFKDLILLKKVSGLIEQELCQRFPDEPYVGAFYGTEPTLIVKDPEIIKLVTTKDFYYFNSREISNYTDKEIITQNLFFTYGDRWRVVRQNMTPLFSSLKLKNMFPLIVKCVNDLDSLLQKEVRSFSKIEMRRLMANYTMDSIGSCSFGVNTNTLSETEGINPFRIVGEKLFDITTFGGIRLIVRSIWPTIFYALRLKLFETHVIHFFHNLLTGVFESRQYKPSQRNDFVDLILGFKKNNYVSGDSIENLRTGEARKINLTVDNDFLVANCVILFAAGFETSATTLSFTLFELAKHKDVQEKAAADVHAYLSRNKELTFDCVNELQYLDACVDETLRLYPVLGVVTREVTEEYTFPSGLQLDRGIRVHIPVYYLHHHPDYFPDPEQYRPERFLGEERKKIRPYTFMPFGEGLRSCIGMRFAKMQMLPGLVAILSKYRIQLAEGMASTVEFEPKALTMQPKGGIYLKLTPRNM